MSRHLEEQQLTKRQLHTPDVDISEGLKWPNPIFFYCFSKRIHDLVEIDEKSYGYTFFINVINNKIIFQTAKTNLGKGAF